MYQRLDNQEEKQTGEQLDSSQDEQQSENCASSDQRQNDDIKNIVNQVKSSPSYHQVSLDNINAYPTEAERSLNDNHYKEDVPDNALNHQSSSGGDASFRDPDDDSTI